MKIHYDDGNFHTMPFSDRYTICLCGHWIQDNYEKDSKRKTKDISKVTCKNCLKKLKDTK